MTEILFEEVRKQFTPNVVGVEDASFRIEKGEFVFFTGKSGAGKSTLLKLTSRQLEATSGRIWVRGHEVGDIRREQLPYFYRQFGMMSKELGLLPDRDVYENVKLAMVATAQPKRLIKSRVLATLCTMGILDKAYANPMELSAGQAARVLLARAIVMNPSILVADEPTANLDPSAAWDLMCLLDELNRMGVTIIVASHAHELVSIMKKRVITLVAGRIVADEKRAAYNSIAWDIYEERRILNERAQNQEL